MIEAGFESVSAWSVFLQCRGRAGVGVNRHHICRRSGLKDVLKSNFLCLKDWARFDSPLCPTCSNWTENKERINLFCM